MRLLSQLFRFNSKLFVATPCQLCTRPHIAFPTQCSQYFALPVPHVSRHLIATPCSTLARHYRTPLYRCWFSRRFAMPVQSISFPLIAAPRLTVAYPCGALLCRFVSYHFSALLRRLMSYHFLLAPCRIAAVRRFALPLRYTASARLALSARCRSTPCQCSAKPPKHCFSCTLHCYAVLCRCSSLNAHLCFTNSIQRPALPTRIYSVLS